MYASSLRFGVLLPLVAFTCSIPSNLWGQSTAPTAQQSPTAQAERSSVQAAAQPQAPGSRLVQPVVRRQAASAAKDAAPTRTYAEPRIAANGSPLGAPIAQPQQPATQAQPQGGPPFQQSRVEYDFVMQILQMWETKSQEIKTFTSEFERLEYDAVFGPGSQTPIIISNGRLSYSKPDRGSFKIEEIRRYKPTDPNNPAAGGKHVLQKDEIGEHWVCDGKAVYEYDHRNKQLVVTTIPPEMRGKEIVNGPLPFLFGAEADKLANRYWIRSIQGDPQMIWLEAYPRWAADAQNYQRVEIMLDRKTMQPSALQVHLPGGQQRHVYTFKEPNVNGTIDALFGGLFDTPRVPWGWKRVTQAEGAGSQAAKTEADGVQR